MSRRRRTAQFGFERIVCFPGVIDKIEQFLAALAGNQFEALFANQCRRRDKLRALTFPMCPKTNEDGFSSDYFWRRFYRNIRISCYILDNYFAQESLLVRQQFTTE